MVMLLNTMYIYLSDLVHGGRLCVGHPRVSVRAGHVSPPCSGARMSRRSRDCTPLPPWWLVQEAEQLLHSLHSPTTQSHGARHDSTSEGFSADPEISINEVILFIIQSSYYMIMIMDRILTYRYHGYVQAGYVYKSPTVKWYVHYCRVTAGHLASPPDTPW